MQMASLDHNELSVECTSTEPEQALCTDSLNLDDAYGTPEVPSRIGEQYQADIPAMMTEGGYVLRTQTWNDIDCRDDIDEFPCMQPAVPLVWVHYKTDNVKHETLTSSGTLESLYFGDAGECKDEIENVAGSSEHYHVRHLKTCSSQSIPELHENPPVKTESLVNAPYDCNKENLSTHGSQSLEMESNSFTPCQKNSSFGQTSESGNRNRNPSLEGQGKGLVDLRNWHLVPGDLGGSWNDIEYEAFLLGLYIFGKNFVQVKKFVETKSMGDILSFYYGIFFKTDAYQRWSECQKIRSKRSIHGHRLFHGLRQQELLSRLNPHISENSKKILVETSEAYNVGKVSLEEYVATLKMIVGLATLVEAVGIGKGKQDLTGITAEPAKVIQRTAIHSEIPTGKACSSLTSEEIIKFLTGGFRLSKARSSDLFWEAVWPRLLARGWHSEQPKASGSLGSKNSLVFLVPSIKKFSRRHVKGTHYFDSITDVLNKVSLDPSLLKIETDEAKDNGVNEDVWGSDAQFGQDRHCCLRPRQLSSNSEFVKFTVVDTSMVYEEPHKVREMRTLPMDTDSQSSISSGTSDSGYKEQSQAPNSVVKSPICSGSSSTKSSDYSERSLNRGMQSEHPEGQSLTSEQISKKDEKVASGPTCVQKRELVALESKKECRESSLTVGGCREKYLSPVSKRPRINPNLGDNNQEANALTSALDKKEGELHSHSKSFSGSHLGNPTSNHSQATLVSSASNIGRRCETTGDVDLGTDDLKETDKSFRRGFIDLNLPHCPSDYEMDEEFETHEIPYKDNVDAGLSGDSFPWEADLQSKSAPSFEPSDGLGSAKESMMQARRQSTRNRPLSTRALEALACGLLVPNRRTRGTKSGAAENFVSRSSRRRTKCMGVPRRTSPLASGNCADSVMDKKKELMSEVVLGKSEV
ncbi:hypothetical protein EJ110_NYTH04478 [Nymphaea thermarum]|nr:hypothetical protein EJ110_NYTH04478 [Nymphaea thermarum]